MMYNLAMAMMTISEARAALPEVVSRVAEGEEITITRHGRAAAVVVRPDVVWARAGTQVLHSSPQELAAALRERAKLRGRTLEEEIHLIISGAAETAPAGLPPLELHMGHSGGQSTWPREEIYDDDDD